MDHLLIETLVRHYHANPTEAVPDSLFVDLALVDACFYAIETSKRGFTLAQVLDSVLSYLSQEAIKRRKPIAESEERCRQASQNNKLREELAANRKAKQQKDREERASLAAEPKRRKYSWGCTLKAYRNVMYDDFGELRLV